MATLRFAKLHGTANDFIYVDARARPRPRGAGHRRHGPAGVGRPPDSGRRGRRGRRAPARGGWAPLGRHLRLDGEPALRRVRGRRGRRPAARRPGAPLRAAPVLPARREHRVRAPGGFRAARDAGVGARRGRDHGVRHGRLRRRRRRGAHGAERPAGGRGAPRRRAGDRLAPRRSGPHDRRRGRGLREAGGGLAMFTGAMTALVTPFRDGEVDTRALEALVEAQIAGGINALVPCGSTGEAATLTHEEHLAVVRAVVRVARGRVPVIAGTGSNSTAEAIRLTRGAEEAGADAALLISPYYNRPTQEGIYRHYAAVAEASLLPLIVYNIPGRTGSNVGPDTIARLAAVPDNPAGKKATANRAPAP